MQYQHWLTQAFDSTYLSLTIKCSSVELVLFLYILQPLYIIRDTRIVSTINVGTQTRNKRGCELSWHPNKPASTLLAVILLAVIVGISLMPRTTELRQDTSRSAINRRSTH
jgi:hypothetical protein